MSGEITLSNEESKCFINDIKEDDHTNNRRTGDWALQIGQPYMKSVQKVNLSAINEALNELYIEDEDYVSLRQSIDDF